VLLVINRDSPVAPWQQLAQIIRERIASGDLAPGGRVPSINTLRQEYDLSYSTVQKTYAALKADGLIITTAWGTFVAEKT
jgi:GntR family transcriptional regulator